MLERTSPDDRAGRRGGIDARASVVARSEGGATRLVGLRSDPPLTLRRTAEAVHLVGTAAGPIGGDRLTLDIDVGEGADLVVCSAAASIVLPGPSGEASRLDISASVGPGGSLDYAPQPTVVVDGCDHHVTTRISLAVGGSLRWREEFVLGRHDEPCGSLLQRFRVDLDGRPLLRSDLAVGPRWPGSLGPAGVDGRRVLGTVLVVREELATEPNSRELATEPTANAVRIAALALEGPAVLVTAIGDSAHAVARALDRALLQIA